MAPLVGPGPALKPPTLSVVRVQTLGGPAPLGLGAGRGASFLLPLCLFAGETGGFSFALLPRLLQLSRKTLEECAGHTSPGRGGLLLSCLFSHMPDPSGPGCVAHLPGVWPYLSPPTSLADNGSTVSTENVTDSLVSTEVSYGYVGEMLAGVKGSDPGSRVPWTCMLGVGLLQSVL